MFDLVIRKSFRVACVWVSIEIGVMLVGCMHCIRGMHVNHVPAPICALAKPEQPCSARAAQLLGKWIKVLQDLAKVGIEFPVVSERRECQLTHAFYWIKNIVLS